MGCAEGCKLDALVMMECLPIKEGGPECYDSEEKKIEMSSFDLSDSEYNPLSSCVGGEDKACRADKDGATTRFWVISKEN